MLILPNTHEALNINLLFTIVGGKGESEELDQIIKVFLVLGEGFGVNFG